MQMRNVGMDKIKMRFENSNLKKKLFVFHLQSMENITNISSHVSFLFRYLIFLFEIICNRI